MRATEQSALFLSLLCVRIFRYTCRMEWRRKIASVIGQMRSLDPFASYHW